MNSHTGVHGADQLQLEASYEISRGSWVTAIKVRRGKGRDVEVFEVTVFTKAPLVDRDYMFSTSIISNAYVESMHATNGREED